MMLNVMLAVVIMQPLISFAATRSGRVSYAPCMSRGSKEEFPLQYASLIRNSPPTSAIQGIAYFGTNLDSVVT